MPTTETPDVPEIIEISARSCKNCKTQARYIGHNVQCPHCQKEFCNNCFKMNKPGDGSTIKCAHCEKIISIHKVVTATRKQVAAQRSAQS